MLKDAVLNNLDFIAHLRQTNTGRLAFEKWAESYPDAKAKRVYTRKAMSDPRKGFLGCIATKVEPKDIRECVETYDNPEYQSISLLPAPLLKQQVYEKTGDELLKPMEGMHISNLPRGLRQYIYNHPDDYNDYLRERKAELEYLKSIRRTARREQQQPPPPPGSAQAGPFRQQPPKRRQVA